MVETLLCTNVVHDRAYIAIQADDFHPKFLLQVLFCNSDNGEHYHRSELELCFQDLDILLGNKVTYPLLKVRFY